MVEYCLTEEKETNAEQTILTETLPETGDSPAGSTPEAEAPKVEEAEKEIAPEIPPGDAPAEKVVTPAEGSGELEKPGEGQQAPDRGRRDAHRRTGGPGGRRGDRPFSNEDKLRMYKKQSEERLLDIKRSREEKVGKKRKR